nr:MAG TPA_asm: hypothetical protein [Caudoviricetes sp.]
MFLLSSTVLPGHAYSAFALSDTFISITTTLLTNRPITSPGLSCLLRYR